MKVLKIWAMIFVFMSGALGLSWAENKSEKTAAVASGNILDAVKADVQKRSKASGKLDLYDAKSDKVRNLDLIALKDDVAQDGDVFIVKGDFRDVSSGDIRRGINRHGARDDA